MPIGKIVEKWVYAPAVEALFIRALGPSLGKELRRLLYKEGLDVAELRPAYALEQWKGFLRLAAAHVFPAAPPHEAYQGLGERFRQGWRLGALPPTPGPLKAVLRLPELVRASNNFNEARVDAWQEGSATLWVREVAADNPFFACGFVHEALRGAGAQEVSVRPVAFDGASATFRLAWR